VHGGETLTVGAQRALGAAWLQTAEARERAHHELRHLGLPAALTDDLLAAAAYQLARDLEHRDQPLATDDALAPAARGLGTAARAMLRARRTAPPHPLRPGRPDADSHPTTPPAAAFDDTRLRAEVDVTDRRRRTVSALAVDRPHERAAALTTLTLATDPRVEPDAAALPPTSREPDVAMVWAGLWYAGRVETAAGQDAVVGGRRAELAWRQRQADAVASVAGLLAETLAIEDGPPGDEMAPVHHTPATDGGLPGSTAPPAASRANEVVHRRAADG
jgi:hypothetical protein